MPLPGTRVVHPRWSDHHRPTASGTHTAECVITRPGGEGTTDPDTGDWTPADPTTIYTGSCRVTPRPTDERYALQGEQRVNLHLYEIAITWDANEPRVGDDIEITAAVDPHLPGKRLLVQDVRYGSEQWERVLLAEENLTEREA